MDGAMELTFYNVEAEGSVLYPNYLRTLHVSARPMLLPYHSLYDNLVFGSQEKDKERIRRLCRRTGLPNALIRRLENDMGLAPAGSCSSQGSAESMPAPRAGRRKFLRCSMVAHPEQHSAELKMDAHWDAHLTGSERRKIHLSRALIFDPEVLAVHRPIDELDVNEAHATLQILKDYVDNRGLELDARTKHLRRPRTVFLSAGESSKVEAIVDLCDYVVRLSGEYLEVERGGGGGQVKGKRKRHERYVTVNFEEPEA